MRRVFGAGRHLVAADLIRSSNQRRGGNPGDQRQCQGIEAMLVSRDGRWLVFDSNLRGNADIYRVPVSGGQPEQLTSDPAHEFAPDLSPDGKEIVCHSWRTGTRDIEVKPLAGGAVERMTDTPAQRELSGVVAGWPGDAVLRSSTSSQDLHQPIEPVTPSATPPNCRASEAAASQGMCPIGVPAESARECTMGELKVARREFTPTPIDSNPDRARLGLRIERNGIAGENWMPAVNWNAGVLCCQFRPEPDKGVCLASTAHSRPPRRTKPA